jgi:RimJ/RimL family protein N-acetyltransferase
VETLRKREPTASGLCTYRPSEVFGWIKAQPGFAKVKVRRQGLGWELMQLVIEWAKADGLSVVEGQVLRENTVMLGMASGLGFEIRADPADAEMKIVRLPIAVLESERRMIA